MARMPHNLRTLGTSDASRTSDDFRKLIREHVAAKSDAARQAILPPPPQGLNWSRN